MIEHFVNASDNTFELTRHFALKLYSISEPSTRHQHASIPQIANSYPSTDRNGLMEEAGKTAART